MVRMKVKVVGLDQNNMVPVVIITDRDENGFIPIVIGPAEAAAIRNGLEGRKHERPMTHDLLKDMIESLGAKVDRVVIHDLRNETYYARIYLKTRDGEIDIDARPSDAIALALRTDAPIYISEEVAAVALMVNKPQEDEEMEEFRKFLDSVTPEDFKQLFQGE
jgi:Uncharacterized conserved protein